MIELVIVLLAIAFFYALVDWRLGLLLCLATALLQDPLRKLTPDQPVMFVVFVGIVFAGACLGAWMRGVPFTPKSVFERNRQVTVAMWLLLLLIIVQALNSLMRFGNPMLPLIGLLTYLLPLPAIIFAYQLVVRAGEARINQFIRGYLLCTMLALITVYLEYAGYDWSVLGQVGAYFLIFDKYTGTVIVPNSGIFRASEIAAWHAATCACFVLLLATMRKINIELLLSAAILIALLMAIAALTGRRKSLIEVAVFAGTYFILWVVLQKGVAKLGIALGVFALAGFAWLVAQTGSELPVSVDGGSLGYFIYVERTKTVFRDAPERFIEIGIAPIMWAYDSFGFFGAGLGVGTQGTQHFGGGGELSGAAEGGMGKITLELGIPGLFVMGWLAISVFNYLWRIMRTASRVSPRLARLSYALFSFLVANVAAFSVGTQAYADLFILLILSWTLGFLLAIPVLLEREVRARQPMIVEKHVPVFQPQTV